MRAASALRSAAITIIALKFRWQVIGALAGTLVLAVWYGIAR